MSNQFESSTLLGSARLSGFRERLSRGSRRRRSDHDNDNRSRIRSSGFYSDSSFCSSDDSSASPATIEEVSRSQQTEKRSYLDIAIDELENADEGVVQHLCGSMGNSNHSIKKPRKRATGIDGGVLPAAKYKMSCTVGNTRSCRFELPEILDLVEDRVNRRTTTVVSFLLVFSCLAYVQLVWLANVHDPYNMRRVAIRPNHLVALPFNSSIESGKRFPHQIFVAVQSAVGDGIEGVRVKCDLETRSPQQSLNILDGFKLRVLPNSSWQYSVGKVSKAFLDGRTIAVTDRAGFAVFSELAVSGPTGVYELVFRIVDEHMQPLGNVEPERLPVSLATDLKSVVPLGNLSTLATNVFLGQSGPTWEILKLQLKDVNDQAATGRRCTAVVLPFVSPQYSSWEKVAFFDQSISSVSNKMGEVTFTRLSIAASASPSIFPAVSCDGHLINILPRKSGNSVPVQVLPPKGVDQIIITLDRPPPPLVTEGDAIHITFRLHDQNGVPIKGQYLIVRIVKELGLQYTATPPGCVACLLHGTSKQLQNPISTRTNSDGEGEFLDLAFSIEGEAGPYTISFDIVGFTVQYNVNVSSRVKLLKLEDCPHPQSRNDSFVSKFLYPLPFIPACEPPIAFLLSPMDCHNQGRTASSCDGSIASKLNYNIAIKDAAENGIPGKVVKAKVIGKILPDGSVFSYTDRTGENETVPSITVVGSPSAADGRVVFEQFSFHVGSTGFYEVMLYTDGISLAASKRIVVFGLINTQSSANTTCSYIAAIHPFPKFITSGTYIKGVFRTMNSHGRPVPIREARIESKSLVASEPLAVAGQSNGTITVDRLYGASMNASAFFRIITTDGSCSSSFMGVTFRNPAAKIDATVMTGGGRTEFLPCIAGTTLPPITINVTDSLGRNVRSPVQEFAFGLFEFPEYIHSLPYPMFSNVEDLQSCSPFSESPTRNMICPGTEMLYNSENTVYNGNGVHTFKNMAVKVGLPGNYRLVPTVNGAMSTTLDLHCASRAVAMQLISPPSQRSLDISEDLITGFAVRFVDARGNPVQGYRATAFIMNCTHLYSHLCVDFSIGSNATLPGSEMHIENSSMVNDIRNLPALSSESDINGIAVFPSIKVWLAILKFENILLPIQIRLGAVLGDPQRQSLSWSNHLRVDSGIDIALKTSLKSIEIITQPSDIAAFGVPLQRQPTVRITLDNHERGSYPPVRVLATLLKNSDKVSLKAMTTSDKNGIALFHGLRFDTKKSFVGLGEVASPLGNYTINFYAEGLLTLSTNVMLSNKPTIIEIKQQPPSTLHIGEAAAAPVRVRLALRNGTPLPGIDVKAAIFRMPLKQFGALDTAVSFARTDSCGYATIRLLLTAGPTGKYTFVFGVDGGIQSKLSEPVEVTNDVSSVGIIGLTSCDRRTETLSEVNIKEPFCVIVKATGSDGAAIPQKSVQILLVGSSGGRIVAQSPRTNSRGTTTAKVKFVSGTTGSFLLRAVVAGVPSEPVEVEMHNTVEFDPDSLMSTSELQYALLISPLLFLPLFCGNSEWKRGQRDRSQSLVWQLRIRQCCGSCCALTFTLSAIIFQVYLVKNGERLYQRPDVFQNLFAAICVVAAISTSMLLCCTFKCCRGAGANGYHRHKLQKYTMLVKRLLLSKSAVAALRSRAKQGNPWSLVQWWCRCHRGRRLQQRSTRFRRELGQGEARLELELVSNLIDPLSISLNPTYEGGVSNCPSKGPMTCKHGDAVTGDYVEENPSPSMSHHHSQHNESRFRQYERGRIQNVMQNLRKTICKNCSRRSQKTPNPHEPFERLSDFFFPLRLLIAFWVSLLFVVLISLFATLLVEWIVFKIDTVYDKVECQQDLQRAFALWREGSPTSSLNFFVDRSGRQTYSKFPNELCTSGESTETLFAVFPILFFNDDLKSFASLLDDIKFALIVAFCLSVSLTNTAILYQWYCIFRQYRRRIMGLRQGNYCFDRRSTGVHSATTFIGFQTWHTVIALTWTVCVLFLVILVTTFIIVRSPDNLIEAVALKIINFFGVFFFINIALKLSLMCFASRGEVIHHRRLFSLIDALYAFLSVATVIPMTTLMFLCNLMFNLTAFVRVDLDERMSSWLYKPAHSSYISMLFTDHLHNNPIVTVFCSTLYDRILLQRTSKNAFETAACAAGSRDLHSIDVNLHSRHHPQQKARPRKRIMSKFWLWITLHNNPTIRQFRYHQLPEHHG